MALNLAIRPPGTDSRLIVDTLQTQTMSDWLNRSSIGIGCIEMVAAAETETPAKVSWRRYLDKLRMGVLIAPDRGSNIGHCWVVHISAQSLRLHGNPRTYGAGTDVVVLCCRVD